MAEEIVRKQPPVALWEIEADDVIHYHKTYYVFARTKSEAGNKIKKGDYFDAEPSKERGESSFSKTLLRSVKKGKS